MGELRPSMWLGLSLCLAWSCADETQAIVPTGVLVVTPVMLDFGEVELGARVTRRITVARERLPATGLAVAWGELFDRAFSFGVVDDAAGTVDVTFAPAVEGGEHHGDLVVQQAGATPVNVALTGRAVSATLRVSATELDFGIVPVGQMRARTVRLSNAASLPVEVVVDEDATLARCGTAVATPFCLAAEGRLRVPAQGAVDLEVRFVPQAVVPEVRGQLSVRSCEACAPRVVALTGRVAEPGLTCTSPLELGPVLAGACATGTVRCAYAVGSARTVQTWRLSARSDPEFTIAPPPPPGRLSRGEPVEIAVTFCPSGGGERTAALEVEDDHPDPAERVVTAQLRGRGADGQDIEVTPAVVELQSTLIAPARRDVVVRNRGTSALVVSDVRIEDGLTSGFSLDARGGFALQPGASRALVVELTARRVGAVRDVLVVRSDDPDQPEVRVELLGEGVDLPPCAYELAPASLDFAAVEVGRSLRRAIEVRNVGPAECLITGARMLSRSPAIALVTPLTGAARLAVGERWIFALDFAPPSAGVFGDALEIGVSSPTMPYVAVPVQGTGVARAPLIVPREIDFGAVGPSCTTREETVTVYNTTATSLTFSQVALEAPGSASFEVLGAPTAMPIPPQGSVSFRVAYRPGTAGAHAAAVRLDAPSGSWRVALSGRDAAAPIQEDRFEAGARAVDLLVVADDSGSMFEEQTWLADSVPALLAFAEATGVDYRVGLTTTDAANGGRLEMPILAPDARPPPATALADAIRQLGTNGSADEQGLEAMYLALSPPWSQGANAGLLRADAELSVLVLSDEEDASAGRFAFYSDFLSSLKSRYSGHRARLFGVIGDVPSGCNGPGGAGGAGARYAAVAEASGGEVGSICSADSTALYAGLAAPLWGASLRFELSTAPVESSLEVRIDGVLVPRLAPGGGEQWSLVGRHVVFAPVAGPDLGAEVSVRYTPACP